MKKVLLGLFVIGSLTFGCEESTLTLLKKADGLATKTGKLIITDMMTGIDGKNVGTKSEEITASVLEYVKVSKHILLEHKVSKEENAIIEKNTELVAKMMKEYHNYIKRGIKRENN